MPAARDRRPGRGPRHLLFGARPKVIAVTSTGRAATLPFERFADRAENTAESDAAIGVLSLPTIRGSFGEPVARPLRATTPATDGPAAAPAAPAARITPTSPTAPEPVPSSGFFDDPDVLPVGAAATFFERGAMTPSGTVATEIVDDPAPAPDLHIPGGAGRPYNPRQRQSLEEGPLERPGSSGVPATPAMGGPAGTSVGPRRHRRGGRRALDPDGAPGGDLLPGDLPTRSPRPWRRSPDRARPPLRWPPWPPGG